MIENLMDYGNNMTICMQSGLAVAITGSGDVMMKSL